MATNLTTFYNELRSKGVLLQHQFELTFTGINIGGVDDALKGVTMWAQGAVLPGRTIEPVPLQFRGYEFGIPGVGKMTNELTLTINASQDLKMRDALLFWMGTLADADLEGDSANGGIKTMPTAEARLDLYNDKMDTILHSYVLKGIFPTNIGDIELTNADPAIATFEGAFRYQYWYTATTPNEF